jgi:hypothetical protein
MQQHVFQERAAQERHAHDDMEKQHHLTRIDAAYWTERGKDAQAQHWQPLIVLAEDYLHRYPEIDEDYLGDFRERLYCDKVSMLSGSWDMENPYWFGRSYCGHARLDTGLSSTSWSVSDC